MLVFDDYDVMEAWCRALHDAGDVCMLFKPADWQYVHEVLSKWTGEYRTCNIRRPQSTEHGRNK